MTRSELIQIEPREVPVACTLTPGALAGRVGELAALAERALRSRAPAAGGERLVFADAPGIEDALREAVAAEASCCSFLRMTLARTADGLVLDVTGPPEAQPVIAQLFRRPPASPASPPPGSRAARP